MMKSNQLLFLINLFIGGFIILYTIYVRFLVVRLPKDLNILNDSLINYKLLIFILLSITICFLALIMNLITLLKFKPSEGMFIRVFIKTQSILDNALFEVYKLLSSFIPNVYDKVSILCQKFYKVFGNKSELFFLFIIYGIRFVIVIAFLIDVFICFQLSFMYKALYLLCISLLIRILFYILKDFSCNLEDAEAFLTINTQGIDNDTQLPITSFKLKDEFAELNLEYHVSQYILCSKISGYLHTYNLYSNFFTPYINIIIYTLYIMGWSYIIFN